ncbi:Cytochrome P450 71B10 [Euphorbia peplus]|nr:Cytochrome P450 71B10 [Euphorbia peplus]
MSDEYPWLFLPLVFFLPVLFHLTRKILESSRKKKKHVPPGPPGLPIIGNLHQLGTLPHCSLSELSKKYGDVMLLHLGYVPTLIISSSEAAKQILKTHDLKTCSRPLLSCTGKLSYNYLDISFTPYTHYWRDVRKLCVVELFSQNRVESFRFDREEEVDLMIDSIIKCSSSGVTVDLSEKTMSLTAEVICRVAFGKSFKERGLDQKKFQEMFHECLEMLGCFSSTDFFPYVGWILDRMSGLDSRLQKNFQEFDEFYEKIIDDHIKKERINKRGDDIIDVLLDVEKSQSESAHGIQFSKHNIKAILMNIFLAGMDTGAVTMVWAMAELVKNPKAMKKVQKEIRSHIGSNGTVIESDIKNLSYLKMVIKETLRLHPPVPLLLPREVISQFNINGYEVFPKTRIQVNAWAIGRDPKLWKNPEEFYPERFNDNYPIDYKELNSYEMLPFGGGRRGCPGVSMAMALIELSLANLLLHFDWKLPNDMRNEDLNMEEAFGLSITKKTPLLLVPIKHGLA